jgi:hypothetical protein
MSTHFTNADVECRGRPAAWVYADGVAPLLVDLAGDRVVSHDGIRRLGRLLSASASTRLVTAPRLSAPPGTRPAARRGGAQTPAGTYNLRRGLIVEDKMRTQLLGGPGDTSPAGMQALSAFETPPARRLFPRRLQDVTVSTARGAGSPPQAVPLAGFVF